MKNLDKFYKEQKALTEIKTKGDLPVRIKGHRELEVLAAPYGGHINGKDADGEFFSDNTDFWVDIGEKRPAAYYHGKHPRGTNMISPKAVGKATVDKRDEEGLWTSISLKENDKFADIIWEAAQNDNVRASSGSVNYLVRTDEKSGEILSWPLAEISLIDVGQGRQPANQLARVALKSIYNDAEIEYPKAFLKSGELEKDAVKDESITTIKETTKMTKETELPAVIDEGAIAAKVLEQFKAEQAAEAKAKADFDEVLDEARKESAEEARNDEQAKQKAWAEQRGMPAYNKVVNKNSKHAFNDEFENWFKTGDHGNYKVFGKAENEKKHDLTIELKLPNRYEVKAKALQIGSDTEGGYLAPDDMRNMIVSLREQLSWVRNVGADIIQTGMHNVKIPNEATAMTNMVVTAEEAGYDTNDPLFGEVSIDIHKFTKLTKMSEELLTDNQSDLTSWYANRLAEIAASTESYYVAVGSGSSQPEGVTVGGTAALTFDSAAQIDAVEIPELFYKLKGQYRQNSAWLVNGETEAYLRGIRDANDFAFDMRGNNVGTSGDWAYTTFYGGRPIYNEQGMATIATAVITVLVGNWRYYTLAERNTLEIARNPYLYQANGQVGFFSKFRWGGAVTQAEAFQYATQA